MKADVDLSGMTIADNPESRQWEATLDGKVLGYSQYRRSAGRIIFTHTIVPPEFEGLGIASRLAKTELDAARAEGLRVTPRCPFVRAYVRRHPEYLPILDFPPERPAEPQTQA